MQTVIDNILLNYTILGHNKAKNTILILHGWQNSLKNWEGSAKLLSVDQNVVLVDLPGMGSSSSPKEIWGTHDYANIIKKFIKKLELKNLTLLGHSFGGKISILLAADENLVKRLILVDPSGITPKDFSTTLKIALSKIAKNFLSEKFSNLFASDDYTNAGELLPIFKKIVSESVVKDAKKITIPTLIIWGENDNEVPLSSAKVLKNLIPNSRLRIIWKASHHPHLDKPNNFLEAINDFA